MYQLSRCALLWLSQRTMAVVRTVEVTSAGRTLAACGAIDREWAGGDRFTLSSAASPRLRTAAAAPLRCRLRSTAQLTIEARCASQATWNYRLHARSGRPARPAGCPRASAAGPHSASGSWRNPGYGQSRPRSALEAPARCLPHPLARSARAAHDLPSRPFVWQDFSLVATEALAPMWFA